MGNRKDRCLESAILMLLCHYMQLLLYLIGVDNHQSTSVYIAYLKKSVKHIILYRLTARCLKLVMVANAF